MAILAAGLTAGSALAVEPADIAVPFPNPLELEVDRIGQEIMAVGIPPRGADSYMDANWRANDPEPPLLMDRALISLRENTCMDVEGVDSMYLMTFLGTKR